MHSISIRLSYILLTVLIATAGASNDFNRNADWKKFSAGIRMAINSPNFGVQQAALRMIVKYGNNLDVNASLPDMVRFYRDQDDEQIRRLALLAIYRIDKEHAFKLVAEQLEVESLERRNEFIRIYSR